MKKLFGLLIGVFFSCTSYGQTDGVSGKTTLLPSQMERSEILQELYLESSALEEDGTLEEIRANRLAIKAAWQEINPKIAALYKPMERKEEHVLGYSDKPSKPIAQKIRPEVTSIKGVAANKLIRDDFVDGLDMDVDGNGDAYIVCYENRIEIGGSTDLLLIYRSQDGGATFSLWKEEETVAPIRKVKALHFNGEGEDYFLVYIMFYEGLLQGLRYPVDGGTRTLQTISDDITDFDVDRNYTTQTSAQRAFMTYLKEDVCETQVMSARSAAGSYGFDWEDEVTVGTLVCGGEVAFTYGRAGGCYTAFTGVNSGSLYTAVNPSSNDPASWENWVITELGTDQEVVNLTMKAARKVPSGDEVVLLTSARPTGSTFGYNHRSYRRENGSAFSELWTGIALPNKNLGPMDTWIRRVSDAEVIQASFNQDDIDNSSEDVVFERRYDGDDWFGGFSLMSDEGLDVWEYFAPAVAELQDNSVCMAFVGNNTGWPYGLYFEGESEDLAIEDNEIEGLRYAPNPVDDLLTISAQNPIEQIELVDVLGRSVMLVSPNKEEVQLMTSYLQSGVYILKINANDKTGVYRIVKR